METKDLLKEENDKQQIKIMNKRLSKKLDCSKVMLTDQSYKKVCDINNIMKVYERTKVMPHVTEKVARYIDNTGIPTIEEAHVIIKEAKEMFYELPAHVRKLMDHNPENMISVLQNPEYTDLLVKNGILVQNEIEDSSGGSTQGGGEPSPKPESTSVSE
jgi:hypothetical protein